MKGSEIIPLNVVSTPVEQTDELNKVLNIMAKNLCSVWRL